MIKDDVLFLYIQLENVACILFVCDTYLYQEPHNYHGKLMYSNIKVHGEYSVPGKGSKQVFYSCAYRYTDTEKNALEPLSDEELQQVGKTLGLSLGVDINEHLCGPPLKSKVTYLFSPFLFELYHSKEDQLLANEIAQKYGIDPGDIRITGGLQLFPKPIPESHDVDVVIPVDSQDQLRKISNYTNAAKDKPVCEFGYVWPLRWFNTDGYLICPFFVYRNLMPPIEKIIFNGVKFKERVSISDDTYSIFNAPLLITDGKVDLVYCRSTLLRGMLRNGQEISLDCPLCKVTRGLYKGAKVALVTNPFKEIANIKDILSEYQT